MPRPIITLTTDFGTADHFVGTMKGVILGILPTAEIVDITHDVTPFQVREAGFLIPQFYPYFPKRTVHVVVVDPGVGTARRPLLVEAAGQFFIAPDNGVLSIVFSREKHKARHITAERYFLKNVSRTFHGRDIFAPVAAHLRKGVAPSKFGKLIENHMRSSFEKPVRTGKRFWSGAVMKIDRFGNLITNFRLDEFPELRVRPFELVAGVLPVHRLVENFAEGERDELVVVEGSSGYLEVISNQGSAAKKIGCGVGAPVELTIFNA
jgi:S-adenosylmethionine hydrolase